MFDIGFWELLLIGVVGLLVIGPERLPEVIRTIGTWVGKIQRFVQGVRSDFQSQVETGELRKLLGDQEQQIHDLKNLVNETKREFERSASDAMHAGREQMDEARDAVESKPNHSSAPSASTTSAPTTSSDKTPS